MKKALVYFSLLISIFGYSQKGKVDSLENLLNKSHNDSVRLKLFVNLCEVCDATDNLKYAKPGIELIESLLKTKKQILKKERLLNYKIEFLQSVNLFYSLPKINYAKLIETHQKLFLAYYQLNDTSNAEEVYFKILGTMYEAGQGSRAVDSLIIRLKYFEKIENKKWTGYYLFKLGDAYMVTGSDQKSLEYYQKSLKVFKEIKDSSSVVDAIHNIRERYHVMRDYKKALEYGILFKEFAEAAKNKERMSAAYYTLAETYKNLLDTTNAFYYNRLHFQKSIELKDTLNIGASVRQKAQIYFVIKDYKSALKYSLQALGIMRPLRNAQLLFGCLRTVAKISLMLKQYDQALKYSKEAESFATQTQTLEDRQNISKLLFDIYNEMGNYQKALEYHLSYLNYKDSLEHFQNTNEIEKKSVAYEFEKSEMALKAEQDKINLEGEKEKQKQKLIIYSVTGILILIVVFSVFVLRSLNITRKQKTIIESQKHIVEEKHKEITDSINYAERIQRSFLSTKQMLDENLNSSDPEVLEGTGASTPIAIGAATENYFVLFKPKDVVSGDFYWSATLNNGNFALATADSTGHGVPGAIMSLLNITSLEKAIETSSSPDVILNSTRKTIIERLKKDGSEQGGKDGMDCSLIVFEHPSPMEKDGRMRLQIANANNPVWIVRNSAPELVEGSRTSTSSATNGNVASRTSATNIEIIEIKPDKMPVGKHDKDNEPFTLKTIDVQEGDIVYALTDGYPDQFGGEKGKKFMSKNLKELLSANAHLPMAEQKQILETTFKNWVGNLEQVDDVTIIGIKI